MQGPTGSAWTLGRVTDLEEQREQDAGVWARLYHPLVPRMSIRSSRNRSAGGRFAELRLDLVPRLEVLECLLGRLEFVHRPVGRPHRYLPLCRIDLDYLAFYLGGDASRITGGQCGLHPCRAAPQYDGRNHDRYHASPWSHRYLLYLNLVIS